MLWLWNRTVSRADELRAQAREKKRVAAMARRAGRALSTESDRAMMLRHATALEAEAAALEAEADALEPPQR